MFRCQHTGKLMAPGVPENRVVLERREVSYENVIHRGKYKGETKITRGWEIVREMIVGPEAYKELTGLEPQRGQPKPQSQPAIRPQRRKQRMDEQPYRKKWRNPRAKGKQQKTEPEKKGPVVEVINRAPKKPQ